MKYHFYKIDRYIETRSFTSAQKAKDYMLKHGYSYFFDDNNIYYD